MHAVSDVVVARQLAHGAAHRHAAVFQRVILEYKVMVARRALGKPFDHHLEKVGHRVKGRMLLKAGIVFQLQQR